MEYWIVELEAEIRKFRDIQHIIYRILITEYLSGLPESGRQGRLSPLFPGINKPVC